MFGGAGLYRDGVMFALVSDGEIFLKTDDLTIQEFREAGCRPFTYSKGGRETTMSYWSLPTEAFEDRDLLKRWAELALETAWRGSKVKGARQE
jgi:DNA transformation protein